MSVLWKATGGNCSLLLSGMNGLEFTFCCLALCAANQLDST